MNLGYYPIFCTTLAFIVKTLKIQYILRIFLTQNNINIQFTLVIVDTKEPSCTWVQ